MLVEQALTSQQLRKQQLQLDSEVLRREMEAQWNELRQPGAWLKFDPVRWRKVLPWGIWLVPVVGYWAARHLQTARGIRAKVIWTGRMVLRAYRFWRFLRQPRV